MGLLYVWELGSHSVDQDGSRGLGANFGRICIAFCQIAARGCELPSVICLRQEKL